MSNKPIDYEQVVEFPAPTKEEQSAEQERFDRLVKLPMLAALAASRRLQQQVPCVPMVGTCPACGGSGVRTSPVCASLDLYSHSQCMVCEGK